MRKVAYIELDTHSEILSNFQELMKDSWVYTTDYYVSEKIANLISFSENVILTNPEFIMGQLMKTKYDLIIIGTSHRYFSTFLEISKKFKTAIIVHNLNFSKSKSATLFNNVFKKDVVFRTKLLLEEGLLSSPNLHKNAKFQFFLDQELQKNSNLKNAHLLPVFALKNIEPYQQKNDEINVVIPGAVSQHRRDYEHVFSVLRNAKPQSNFQFIFLGKASGTKLEKLKKLQFDLSSNIKIQFFEEKIPSAEFSRFMEKADVLWCPIQKETEFFSVNEFYGSTKMTGNLGDAIQYGKPAIFPKNYPVYLPFLFSEEDDIFTQFQKLATKSFDFQTNYRKERVLAALENLLLEII